MNLSQSSDEHRAEAEKLLIRVVFLLVARIEIEIVQLRVAFRCLLGSKLIRIDKKSAEKQTKAANLGTSAEFCTCVIRFGTPTISSSRATQLELPSGSASLSVPVKSQSFQVFRLKPADGSDHCLDHH
jgi:hypothetical protein